MVQTKILLASKSPRRHEIFKLAGLAFDYVESSYEEVIPKHLTNPEEIPAWLAEQKAIHTNIDLKDSVLVTADTLVFLDKRILGKPKDADQAFEFLQALSGKMHRVVSGVCLKTETETILISDITKVYFRELSKEELIYYIETCKPFDKAGAYGAQDWIGTVGIEKIEGSYFNVMGFPMHRVYPVLQKLMK